MSLNATTLWRHHPCARDMSFALTDRPDKQGEYCDICRVTDTRWVFTELRDSQGSTVEFGDPRQQ